LTVSPIRSKFHGMSKRGRQNSIQANQRDNGESIPGLLLTSMEETASFEGGIVGGLDREPCGGGLTLFPISNRAQNASVCGFVYHDADKHEWLNSKQR
jgi:hypothetical protein